MGSQHDAPNRENDTLGRRHNRHQQDHRPRLSPRTPHPKPLHAHNPTIPRPQPWKPTGRAAAAVPPRAAPLYLLALRCHHATEHHAGPVFVSRMAATRVLLAPRRAAARPTPTGTVLPPRNRASSSHSVGWCRFLLRAPRSPHLVPCPATPCDYRCASLPLADNAATSPTQGRHRGAFTTGRSCATIMPAWAHIRPPPGLWQPPSVQGCRSTDPAAAAGVGTTVAQTPTRLPPHRGSRWWGHC